VASLGAVTPDPQEMCPTGAFRYYRRRCGVSNLTGEGAPSPTFPDLRNLNDLRALRLDLQIIVGLYGHS